MDFTLNNGLSMTGGDDFTTIYEEIDTLNATVVFKAGAQTITGDKTITGDLVVNNVATTITANDTIITGGSLKLKATGGADKYAHDSAATVVKNDSVYISDTAGTSGFIITGGNVATQIPITKTITQEVGVNTKMTINSTDTTLTNSEIDLIATTGLISITAADAVLLDGTSSGLLLRANSFTKGTISQTDTTLTNDTTNIVSGVANKVAISGTATTLDNTTTNIRSGGTNKITTNATTTTLNNTGGTTLQIASDPKISLLSASTTLNNTATFINSGGSFRYSQNATDTQIRNTLVQLQAGALDVKYNQTATQTDITNTTVIVKGNVVSLSDETDTVRYDQDNFATIMDNSEIRLRAAGTTRYLQAAGSTSITNDTVVLEIGNGTNKYAHTTTASTISNTTINLQDATPTTRFTQNNGTTTLTNTSINATGNLYTSAYLLGTSGGSNIRLASIQMPLGIIAIPTGSSTPITITGNWSPSGTSSLMRTPEWGNFYPLYAMIGFDNGTITGGGTMTVAIRIREETNNYDYTTDAFSLVSGTLNAPTGGAGDFTTFTAGSNERISGGVLIRAQIVLTRTANITASTKSCYFTAYGYQTR